MRLRSMIRDEVGSRERLAREIRRSSCRGRPASLAASGIVPKWLHEAATESMDSDEPLVAGDYGRLCADLLMVQARQFDANGAAPHAIEQALYMLDLLFGCNPMETL
jgi:hypothetical protein